LGPGPDKVGQGGLKTFTYDVTHKKPAFPEQKIFFRVEIRRLAKSFKPLNSSLPLSAPELCSHKSTCNLFFLCGAKSLKPTECES